MQSCNRDCSRKVVEMELVPVTTTVTDQESNVDGYYESEFQDGSINFVADFVHQGAGEFCDYSWSTYPVDNGMRLFTGDDIVFDGDTFPAGTDITDNFFVTNLENNYVLKYLIISKGTVPTNGRYKIIGRLELDNATILSDSTIVEMN